MAKKRFWQKVRETFMRMKRRLKRRRRVITDIPQTVNVALPASFAAAAIPLPPSTMTAALARVNSGPIEPVIYRAIAIPGSGGPVAQRVIRWGRIFVIVALVAAVALGAFGVRHFMNANASTNGPGDSTVTTSTVEASATTTWKMVSANHEKNRWFLDGIEAINNAKTPEDSKAAAHKWLEGVKRDPGLLAGASKLLLNQAVDPQLLVGKDSMATTQAVATTQAIVELFNSSAIVPHEAPETGYNTGVNDGSVVRADIPGITGNRKAIRITTPDGRVFWILGRCGNIVTPGKPSLPSGETDNPPHKPDEPLEPKSSDPRDYKRPGDGSERDSGSGVKPKATVTTPPESKPPVVVTEPPKRDVPKVEPKLNPDKGKNEGDSGNPFG